MAKIFNSIEEPIQRWIAQRELFFVATAPLGAEGRVNVSPKGPIETLRILDEHTVAYLDMVGSGAETIAHLRENGRIAIMLCAFQGPPRIVRLHGRGTVVAAGADGFDELLEGCAFATSATGGLPEARRAIVHVGVDRVADACGYGVPLMSCEGQRPHARAWAAKKLRTGGENALKDYQRENNSLSIDGLPALDPI